uniref:Uncharacterized protein n=1 Tax=Oryza sativa subsp. japonica TaxID=39947 RepID=Q651A0_ORYSJ|nr:hypothetical protein [Oryza sativa Japonica Group]BAD54674.1 hypothetical protein [Oryza sativa Japonica Group]
MTDVTGLIPVMSSADSHDSTSHLLPAKVEISQNTGVGYYASQRPEPVYIARVLCVSCLASLPHTESLESLPESPAEPAKGGLRGLPPQSFGIEHIPLPKPSVNNFQQNGSFVQSTTHKAEETHRTNDTKLASSAGGQFVEDFGSKIDNLIEEICRDVEEKFNAYILSKGSKPIFNQQRKPINLELSANEKEVAMLDLCGNIGPFVLPTKFRAKDDDEHLDDGARNRDDKVNILESHQRTNLGITQVKKSECFSNISNQRIQSTINEGRLQFATPRKSHAKDDRFDKRNQSRWSSMKKSSAQSGDLVTNQNPPKSFVGNGSQPRHSCSLSNWQKKQLHKLSAEKLRDRVVVYCVIGV